MGKNNYNVICEIGKELRCMGTDTVPRVLIERLIRERIGGHPKTVEQYMRMLDQDLRIIRPGPDFSAFVILPAYNVKEASPANKKLLETAEGKRNPHADDKPVIGAAVE